MQEEPEVVMTKVTVEVDPDADQNIILDSFMEAMHAYMRERKADCWPDFMVIAAVIYPGEIAEPWWRCFYQGDPFPDDDVRPALELVADFIDNDPPSGW